MRPGPAALVHAQDKLAMRRRLTELGGPVPPLGGGHAPEELAAFGAAAGWPVVLKTSRGGYDGKGVRLLHAQPTDRRRIRLAGAR